MLSWDMHVTVSRSKTSKMKPPASCRRLFAFLITSCSNLHSTGIFDRVAVTFAFACTCQSTLWSCIISECRVNDLRKARSHVYKLWKRSVNDLWSRIMIARMHLLPTSRADNIDWSLWAKDGWFRTYPSGRKAACHHNSWVLSPHPPLFSQPETPQHIGQLSSHFSVIWPMLCLPSQVILQHFTHVRDTNSEL